MLRLAEDLAAALGPDADPAALLALAEKHVRRCRKIALMARPDRAILPCTRG